MAPRLNFFKWGARETPKGSQVIVKMEVDVSDEKGRVKTAKQVKWILLLKANRAVGCLAWLAAMLWAILGTINGRLIVRKGVAFASEKLGEGKLMLRVIKAFLAITLVVLVVEVVAFLTGWQYFESYKNLDVLHGFEVQGLVQLFYVGWLEFRGWCIVPLLQSLLTFCVILFVVQSLDRLVLCLGCLYIKARRIRPVINGEPFNSDDVEGSLSDYPMVLVQIPMCNEREVYDLSISAVCQLDWPKERLLIQVLDDSDDKSIQRLIKSEVSKWNQKGINIIYRHRLVRTGYKAGNLNSAMSCDYVKDYEFVAIFDADFQPTPDFLKRTVPHFKGNPELALVQARWDYVNKDENLLTRLQHISTCYHFEVEQQVNGVFLNFFGFNGTAGVWRIKALEDSGGWLERTTVEDMDIAVRAHLNGWKFIYLNDVKVLCEVPESFEAYRKQQHRWHSGPMQLFRLCLPAVIKSKIPIWKKAYLILLFFLLRKLILPFYSFALFCILLPLTMFIPEVKLPMAVIFYVQILMTASNVLPAPKYIPFLAPYILFENTMLVTKFNAMVSGLFQLGSSYEWVVTKKVGRSSAIDHDIEGASVNDVSEFILVKEQKEQSLKPVKKTYKIYRKELALAFLCLFASVRSLSSAHGQHFYYLLFQGLTFLLVGLDLIGQQAN